LFFCKIFVRDTFDSDKYVTRYAVDTSRETLRTPGKVWFKQANVQDVLLRICLRVKCGSNRPIYRMFYYESVLLRKCVPLVKFHQYNETNTYPNLNGHGENGAGKFTFMRFLILYVFDVTLRRSVLVPIAKAKHAETSVLYKVIET
jgi:hypothetical protein